MQVLVRDNNVDQALRALKKKMQREGIFREMKMRGHYEKPSEKRAREKAEAVRRARKLARKRAQREGLLPGPKPAVARTGALTASFCLFSGLSEVGRLRIAATFLFRPLSAGNCSRSFQQGTRQVDEFGRDDVSRSRDGHGGAGR